MLNQHIHVRKFLDFGEENPEWRREIGPWNSQSKDPRSLISPKEGETGRKLLWYIMTKLPEMNNKEKNIKSS
jgi:hypothetical protein